jgi:hypothetical protein
MVIMILMVIVYVSCDMEYNISIIKNDENHNELNF